MKLQFENLPSPSQPYILNPFENPGKKEGKGEAWSKGPKKYSGPHREALKDPEYKKEENTVYIEPGRGHLKVLLNFFNYLLINR
jgi:hypothetical protein